MDNSVTVRDIQRKCRVNNILQRQQDEMKTIYNLTTAQEATIIIASQDDT